MNKRPGLPEPDDSTVRAIASFKHNGVEVRAGDMLRLSVVQAAELVAVGMVERSGEPDQRARLEGRGLYARRDMQAKN